MQVLSSENYHICDWTVRDCVFKNTKKRQIWMKQCQNMSLNIFFDMKTFRAILDLKMIFLFILSLPLKINYSMNTTLMTEIHLTIIDIRQFLKVHCMRTFALWIPFLIIWVLNGLDLPFTFWMVHQNAFYLNCNISYIGISIVKSSLHHKYKVCSKLREE